MGVYSNNRTQLGNYSSEEVMANESYNDTYATLQMVQEGFQNDQIIFEAVLGLDFQEICIMQENGDISEIVNEASVGGFFDKIKEFLKKAWEKLKGIFKSFLSKFDSVVMRDNKAFVEKYKRAVMSKNLSKLKYKWAKPIGTVTDKTKESQMSTELQGSLKKCIDDTTRKDITERADNGDLLDDILSNTLGSGSTDSKSYAKDFKDFKFDSMETEEGLESTRLNEIIGVLCDKKMISDIEKYKKGVDKYFSDAMKAVDKLQKEIVSFVPNNKYINDKAHSMETGEKEDKTNVKVTIHQGTGATKAVEISNAAYKVVSIYQNGMNMYTGRLLAETKFHVAQCRAVFNKAVSHNPKKVNESTLLEEVSFDAGLSEVMTSFSQY